jgi:hypothetical protein
MLFAMDSIPAWSIRFPASAKASHITTRMLSPRDAWYPVTEPI